MQYTVEQLQKTPHLSQVEDFYIRWKSSPLVPLPEEAHEGGVQLVTSSGVVVFSDHHTSEDWKISEADFEGRALYSIPWSEITHVFTGDEYHSMCQCRDVDYHMLDNAR